MSLFIVVFSIVYLVPAMLVWRSLTGYAAWRIHTTAEKRSDIKPELDDWVGGAILTFLVAIPFWWLLLLFQYAPQWVKSEGEREGERLSQQIRIKRLQLETDRQLKELENGDEAE